MPCHAVLAKHSAKQPQSPSCCSSALQSNWILVGDPGLSTPSGTGFDSPNRASIAFGVEYGPYVCAGVLPAGRGLAGWDGTTWVLGSQVAPNPTAYSPLVDLAIAYDYSDAVYGFATDASVALPFYVRYVPNDDPIFSGTPNSNSGFPPPEVVAGAPNIVDVAVAADSGMLYVALATAFPNPSVRVYQSSRFGSSSEWVPYEDAAPPELSASADAVRSIDIAYDGNEVFVAATLALPGIVDAVVAMRYDYQFSRWIVQQVAIGITEGYTAVSLALINDGQAAIAFCDYAGRLSESRVKVLSVNKATFGDLKVLDDASRGAPGIRWLAQVGRHAASPPIRQAGGWWRRPS